MVGGGAIGGVERSTPRAEQRTAGQGKSRSDICGAGRQRADEAPRSMPATWLLSAWSSQGAAHVA